MSRLAPFAAGLALGLAIALIVNVMRGPGPRPPPKRAPIQDAVAHHAQTLGIDRPTLDEIWGIANGARVELDAHRAVVREHKDELGKILDATEVDRKRMAAAVEKVSAAESKLRTRELEVMLEIRALLSPEQIETLKKLDPPPPPRRPR